MKKSISKPSGATPQFHLGTVLGRRQAFSAIAGRCSAADAACLRQIREEKEYRSLCADWGEFCSKHLGLSKTQANRIIQVLEDLGPGYFELAQVTRITPEAYRVIAPAVTENAIHVNGEAIALIPENAEKVAAAVEELRKAAVPEPAARPSTRDRLASLDRRFREMVAEFTELSRARPGAQDRELLLSALKQTYTALIRLEVEMGA